MSRNPNLYTVALEDVATEILDLGEAGKRYVKQSVRFEHWVNPHDPSKKMVLDRKWARRSSTTSPTR